MTAAISADELLDLEPECIAFESPREFVSDYLERNIATFPFATLRRFDGLASLLRASLPSRLFRECQACREQFCMRPLFTKLVIDMCGKRETLY